MMQTRKKQKNPLAVVFFIAAFGFTYLLMPYVMDFFNIDGNKEIIDRVKNGQIVLEFIIFVVIFLTVAFAMELILKLFNRRKKK